MLEERSGFCFCARAGSTGLGRTEDVGQRVTSRAETASGYIWEFQVTATDWGRMSEDIGASLTSSYGEYATGGQVTPDVHKARVGEYSFRECQIAQTRCL